MNGHHRANIVARAVNLVKDLQTYAAGKAALARRRLMLDHFTFGTFGWV